MTAKQKKLSAGSETLKISKRQSSGKSTISTTPKQDGKGTVLRTRVRRKTVEKETAKAEKALLKGTPIVSRSQSRQSEAEVTSPEFGGVASPKTSDNNLKKMRSKGQVGRPKLQLHRVPMVLPEKCSCSRSKCLKLYCECFAKQGFCSDKCGCKDCFNKAGCES